MKDNQTLNLILNRATTRLFNNKKIPKNYIDILKKSFMASSNWINGQQFSAIFITKQDIKKKLSILSKQDNPKECQLFVVIVADMYRHYKIQEFKNQKLELDYINSILITSVDATLAGQNIVLAAESLGLKSVIVGGIRDELSKVIKLLNLPKYTFPVFGISIGYSDDKPIKPPRLDESVLVFDDKYNPKKFTKQIMNKIDQEYLKQKRHMSFSDRVVSYYKNVPQKQTLKVLQEQGFETKK